MAFDAFIKIDGVPGEATDDKHKEWIEIESFGWGVQQQAVARGQGGGGGMAGKASFNDFSVVKSVDKATPSLFQACATGSHNKLITVSFCRATGDKTQYLEYKFSDVVISSYQASGAPGGGTSLPTEQVSFSFAKVEMTYTMIDKKTGKAAGNVVAGYDVQAGKKL